MKRLHFTTKSTESIKIRVRSKIIGSQASPITIAIMSSIAEENTVIVKRNLGPIGGIADAYKN
jgi:hypothetical protein